jgi:hypothetical protein
MVLAKRLRGPVQIDPVKPVPVLDHRDHFEQEPPERLPEHSITFGDDDPLLVDDPAVVLHGHRGYFLPGASGGAGTVGASVADSSDSAFSARRAAFSASAGASCLSV